MTSYIGEWSWAAWIGKSLLYLAFLSITTAAIAFTYKAVRERKSLHPGKSQIGCIIFRVHFIFLLAAAALLFTLFVKHRFEFMYVWQYSSRDLPLHFLISSLWAGQEGSFLLWAIFQGLLGWILMRTSGRWQAGTMAVYSAAQMFVISALLGIDLGFTQIGKNPFILIRETVGNIEGTIFARPDYLMALTDGNGLNPLLENYWMVIHPPVLFLGYASVLAPYSLAIAALIRRKPLDWIPIVLPWVIFSILTLGVGIILGGMWAYVSLTFGGFWAWDPVENASYIPWMVMVAALHLLLVARKRQRGILLAFVFTILAYILVLYASLLTRSGILGNTSVHAFGENGLLTQLLITLIFFTLLPMVLIIRRYSEIKTELPENYRSREFWMVIGALIMAVGVFQVGFVTSIPVWNKLFGLNMAPPANPVAFYNAWQMPFAIIMALLMGLASFLTYRDSHWKKALRRTVIFLIISFVVGFSVWISHFANKPLYLIYLLSSFFLIGVSLDVTIKLARKSVNAGGMVTHLGLGLFLAGIMLTFANSTVISRNTSRMSLGDQQTNAENQIMFRGDTVQMGPYEAVYTQREEQGRHVYYTLEFFLRKNDTVEKAFTVRPSINRNEKMGYVYNPSTHNMLWKDVYTYISFAQDGPGFFNLTKESDITLKDTLFMKGYWMVLDSLSVENSGPELDPENVSIIAFFRLYDTSGALLDTTRAAYIISQGIVNHMDGNFNKARIIVSFRGISEQPGTIVVSAWKDRPDFIVVKVVINPYINLIWLGVLVMVVGMIMAWYRRLRQINQKFV
ncbi:MAG: cytochrome c biogenesis protein CcsA [Bacteroidales bacterium]